MSSLILVCAMVVLGARGQELGDGDTLRARCDGLDHTVQVRLPDVDAPENADRRKRWGEQPWARESREALVGLCLHKSVLIHPVALDRDGRLIGRVWCGGVEASVEQVRNGYAWAALPKYLPKGSALPALEAQAREERRGLWSLPVDQQVPPWIHRKQK